MADTRLYRENVTLALAFPQAFADWEAPTAAELNGALVYNITCALNEDGTTFDLGDSDTDDTITFCQSAGSVSPTFFNPEIVFEAERSTLPLAADQANEAFGLMAFPDIEYFAILRVGKDSDIAFAVGDRVSLVRIATDLPVDVAGSGENVRIQQNFLNKGDVNWGFEVAA
jgi:hypothetical protein